MSASNRLFLAIDGGNYKTEGLLLDHAGNVLSHVNCPGCSPQREGLGKALESLMALKTEALDAGGLPPNSPVARLGVFQAGVDLPEERTALKEALAQRLPQADLIVENDIHAVLWAGMRRTSGVAVICGGGINALARSATGKVASYLSLGQISGEWGGGLSLGREVLFAASRAEDGRGPETAMRYMVSVFFGRATVRQAVADIAMKRAQQSKLAELTKVLFQADLEGDAVARDLVDRLAGEVVGMAAAAMRRASISPSGSDVVLSGGVLLSGHRRLDDLIDHRFAQELPGAQVKRLTTAPVVGAALACIGADKGGPDANDKMTTRLIAGMERFKQSGRLTERV